MATIVSAFYAIPSKQPYEFYRPHLERWFRAIRAPVIFFTTEDIWHDIQSFGVPLWHVQPIFQAFESLSAWNLGRTFWERQRERDVEPYHTPELAAIWYEKRKFIRRAAAFTDAPILIWCDAGCVRDDISEEAAKEFGQRLPPWLYDDTLHLQSIREQPIKPFYVYPEYRIACGIMAGTRMAWERATDDYAAVLQEYDQVGVSAVSDQYLTASCQDRWPTHYRGHAPSTLVDPWFFFLGII
jgi:hypothetical protein